MRAVSLFVAFALAKMAILWGHSAPITGWSLAGYAWQDALVALLFAAFDFAARKMGVSKRAVWAVYWIIVVYTAINIPVGRVLATPLTRPMLRAARGPLADSMLVYLTVANVLLIASIVLVAALLPRLLQSLPRTFWTLSAACAIAVILIGPAASRRVDTRGMDRNVIVALLGTGTVHAGMRDATTAGGEWRRSRFETGPVEDLSRFRASAQGFNVVIIGLESTAAQYLSLYGSQYEVMPNLSALAKNALVFDNAYAVYPESIKGLFSILCSTFPAFDSQPEEYRNLTCPSVASALGDAGYRTAMFHSGRFGYLGMESIIRQPGYQTLEDAGDIGGNHNSSFGVDEPATVDRILGWIDRVPHGQPFFVTYLPIAGHHPYATPAAETTAGGPFRGSEEIDQYRNALHYGDVSLGALVEGIRARGLERKTIWMIYGDHGEAFHQHEGNYGHTFFLYEENVHVPLIIAAPGILKGQKRVRKVVSLVDAAPTLLDLMGIAASPNDQGRSMLDATPRMALFFADYSLGLLGLRDDRWKFVYEIAADRGRLFDLQVDPKEMSDVAAREPARSAWYRDVVRGWSSAQKRYLTRLR